jgi:putative endonuclease
MKEKLFYVYILASKRNGTLYVGTTTDLARRVLEHKQKLVESFTKKYNVVHLVYYECFTFFEEALSRERCLKRFRRKWKLNLIESKNILWRDLFSEILR